MGQRMHVGFAALAWLALAPAVAGCEGAPGGEEGVAETPIATEAAMAPARELSAAEREELVAAFQGGVAALEVGDTERGIERLERAGELAPQEPAIAADLALAAMRVGDAETADAELARALGMAPEEPAIALLEGQIRRRQAREDDAIAALERATELAPESLRAQYALYAAREASLDEATRAAALAPLEAVIALAPENLAAQVEKARLAAALGDADATTEALDALAEDASGWAPEAVEALETARTAAADNDAAALGRAVTVLRNLLIPETAYQGALAELGTDIALVGEPIDRFLRMENPTAMWPAADRSISWVREDGEGYLALFLPLGEDGAIVLVELDEEGATIDATGEAQRIDWTVPVGPQAFAAIDADNDRQAELAVAGSSGFQLYRLEDEAWTDVTETMGLDESATDGDWSGVWLLDLELDGDMDLLLAPMGTGINQGSPLALRNRGDGSWETITPLPDVLGMVGFLWADLSGDGTPDIALVDWDGGLRVYENLRSGQYGFLGSPDIAFSEDFASLGAQDLDGDGVLDLSAIDSEGRMRAYSMTGGQGPQSIADDRWLTLPEARSHVWVDVDNNGARDLVMNASTGTYVLLADDVGLPRGEPHWIEYESMGPEFTAADIDGDGLIDIAGQIWDGSAVWTHQGGEAGYGHLSLRPRAVVTGDQRNNSFGLGGEVEARTGLRVQRVPIDGPALHFGLGDAELAEVVRIHWPNGIAQAEFDLAAEQDVLAEQRLKGSCPWLFAWDGREMGFVTDVLWRSPLGLRINAQVTAGVVQTEDRVKVSGAQLRPRNGVYDLRVTAELQETHFFDQVGLWVVDHPEGTEMFLDERFSIPPPSLEPRITSPVTPVASAVDDEGRDVRDLVAERDGVYLDSFPLGRWQGAAPDHGVEIELPAGAGGDRPLLVAQGWIYPTDSSLNVALSQGEPGPPAALRLERPDGAGGWEVVREGIGFPAGKGKTLLIDLAEIFPEDHEGPRRLRLATSMEIYWDRLGVVEELPEAERRIVELAPESVELGYRGFSETTRWGQDEDQMGPRSAPERPFYDRLRAGVPVWRDLEGMHTRFGDVAPLTAAVDDRYAILNAGDELRMRFPAEAEPAAGWTRDFVFQSDGWVKDGDVNTTFSRTVHPLPSQDRPEYVEPGPGGPTPPLVEDPIFRAEWEDWRDYHTRYVSPRRFRDALRPKASP